MLHTLPLRCSLALLAIPLAAQMPIGIWHALPNSNMPTRANPAMAFDTTRNQVMFYGGADGRFGGLQNNIWYFDGTHWSRAPGSAAPVYADSSGFAWDTLRNRGILAVFAGPNYQTWSWNGSTWTQLPATVPTTVQGTARMVYDAARDRMLLVIGEPGSGIAAFLTFEFDGTSWSLRSTGGPPRRIDFSMAYYPAHGRTLLFGGAPAGNQLNDTWEWDGVSWIQSLPALSPSPRQHAALAYDPQRQTMLMFGGFAQAQWLGDLWEWNGTQWQRCNSRGTVPASRSGAGMIREPQTGRMLVCGGFDGSNVFTETFALTLADPATGTWSTFGQGCAGVGGTPSLDVVSLDRPYVGEVFSLRLANVGATVLDVPIGVLGFSRTQWGSIPLPLSLDSLGMTGCTAYIEAIWTQVLSNNAGTAAFDLPLPFDVSLRGLPFFVQGMVLEPGVNAFGAVVSNAGEAVIGVR